jgi:hypothetical protein
VERQELAEHLRRLPVEELVSVLQDVFASRLPFPNETAFCRNRFFLGVASSDLESDKGEPESWGPWTIEAVAYPDPAHYGDTLGPDWGLCQSGACCNCDVRACSNVKNGICAICGATVYMT